MGLAAQSLRSALRPPPDETVSEWADNHRYLSGDSAAEPGRWRTDRAPYQRGVMDAVNNPRTHTIVWMKSAQVGRSSKLTKSRVP